MSEWLMVGIAVIGLIMGWLVGYTAAVIVLKIFDYVFAKVRQLRWATQRLARLSRLS